MDENNNNMDEQNDKNDVTPVCDTLRQLLNETLSTHHHIAISDLYRFLNDHYEKENKSLRNYIRMQAMVNTLPHQIKYAEQEKIIEIQNTTKEALQKLKMIQNERESIQHESKIHLTTTTTTTTATTMTTTMTTNELLINKPQCKCPSNEIFFTKPIDNCLQQNEVMLIPNDNRALTDLIKNNLKTYETIATGFNEYNYYFIKIEDYNKLHEEISWLKQEIDEFKKTLEEKDNKIFEDRLRLEREETQRDELENKITELKKQIEDLIAENKIISAEVDQLVAKKSIAEKNLMDTTQTLESIRLILDRDDQKENDDKYCTPDRRRLNAKKELLSRGIHYYDVDVENAREDVTSSRKGIFISPSSVLTSSEFFSACDDTELNTIDLETLRDITISERKNDHNKSFGDITIATDDLD